MKTSSNSQGSRESNTLIDSIRATAVLRCEMKKEPGLATGLFQFDDRNSCSSFLCSYRPNLTYCTVKVMSSRTNEVCFEAFS
jgi:hypothetical protein